MTPNDQHPGVPRDRVQRRRAALQARRRRRRIVAALALAAVAAAGAWAALGAAGDHQLAEHAETKARRDASTPTEAVTVRARPRPIVRFTVGSGSRSAAIVRRAGTSGPQPVVVFLHGWALTDSAAYRRWIRHLAATGNTVIVPRYQRDERSDPRRVRAWAMAGIRRALDRVTIAPGTLVVAGHSAGASIAADYAATARGRGLPRPAGVFAVYPGRRILGYPSGIPEADPARIPSTTFLTVMAGSTDRVVGLEPARALYRRANAIPASRRRLIVVRDPAAADHYAPTRSGQAARRTFWRRLDRFIASARR